MMVARPVFPQEPKEPEAKTVPGQAVEYFVDDLTFGICGGAAGKLVDMFFDDDEDNSHGGRFMPPRES